VKVCIRTGFTFHSTEKKKVVSYSTLNHSSCVEGKAVVKKFGASIQTTGDAQITAKDLSLSGLRLLCSDIGADPKKKKKQELLVALDSSIRGKVLLTFLPKTCVPNSDDREKNTLFFAKQI